MKNKVKLFFIIICACVCFYIDETASNYIKLVYSTWRVNYNISIYVDDKQSGDRFDVVLNIYASRWHWYLHLPCHKEIIIHDAVNPELLSGWDVISVNDDVINLKNEKQVILVRNACKS